METHSLDGGDLCISPPPRCPMVVKFMATWCDTCSADMEAFTAAVEKLPAEKRPPVLIVGVLDKAEILKEYGKKLPFDHVMAADDKSTLQQKFAVTGIPATVVVSPEGKQLQVKDPLNGKDAQLLAGPRNWLGPAGASFLKELCK